MSWLSKAVGGVSDAVSQLDPTSSHSFAGKATAAIGTGGLSLLPRNTVAGKIGVGLAKSVHDSQSPIGAAGNAVGAAVGAKGAGARLAANLSGIKRQVPVVLGAAKGFAAGGPVGAVATGVGVIGATYVAREFIPKSSTPIASAQINDFSGNLQPTAVGASQAIVGKPPSAAPLLLGGAALLLLL